MIRSRPKPKVQRGPAPPSDDRFDKFVAAMSSGVPKDSPEFARAPHYFTAVAGWFDRLSLDQTELVCIVKHIDTTPGYGGEKTAVVCAAGLPPVPVPPAAIRKAWGHG